MSRDELLSAYQAAASAEDALRVLDESGNGDAVLGELYDHVADRLANEDRYAQAVTAQRKAVDLGFTAAADPREMLAWYLLKAGEAEEADALWSALLAERPADPELALTAGVAHRDAGRDDRAAELLGRSIELTLAISLDATALREAVAERAASLEALGREGEAIDAAAAAALDRLERQAAGEAIAAPWYPEAEYAVALDRLPGFAADWNGHDHASYSRELDRRLRDVVGVHGRVPAIVPVAVEPYLAFAGAASLDADWAETRARYADEHRADALAWPPGRNDTCWCGVDAKYKRHCGA